ncbi:MAG: ATP-binding protein [Acidimicrobiales bacterium]
MKALLARLRLGLRSRIAVTFAVFSLLLSVVLAGSSLLLIRNDLLNRRVRLAQQSAFRNALTVQNLIAPSPNAPEPDLNKIVPTLPTGESRPFIVGEDPDKIYNAGDLTMPRKPVTSDAWALVSVEGKAAKQLYRNGDDGLPYLLIGVPLKDSEFSYWELSPLEELENTLERLLLFLAVASGLTTVAGALLGRWASRRVLRPLALVSNAAEDIAEGRFDTRLATFAARDPDLEGLVASFNHMAAALQLRIERDARFASDVSHELRSPLMTLAASLEVLVTRRDDMPERAQSALDLLAGDVERYQRLVSDLLEISRFDAGKQQLSLSPLGAVEFLRAAATVGGHRGLPVLCHDADAELVILADKRRILQVVSNLLDNAAKYGGGPTAITLEHQEDRVLIGVEDDGAGVPEAEREVVFDRFARGAASGRRGLDTGTGLGLSLVAEHVHLHGGDVWVEDRPDGKPGARFVVSLPAPAAEALDTPLELVDEPDYAEVP